MQDTYASDTERKDSRPEKSGSPASRPERAGFAEIVASEEGAVRSESDSAKRRLSESVSGIKALLEKEKGKDPGTDAAAEAAENRLRVIMQESEVRAAGIEQGLQSLSAASREASETIKILNERFEANVSLFRQLIERLKSTNRN